MNVYTLLFLLFINDIDNNIQSPLRLFADDTILCREIWSKDDHNIIQNDIQTLFKWSQTWKLDFNVTKCKVLTISNKKDPDKFNYTLNTDPLEHVDSHQYLGVTINSKLRWNTHVSAITAKATRTLNVIRRTLHPCHPEVKKVAYMSLFRPKLEYSSAAWNPHTQNDTTQLEKVQRNNGVARIFVWGGPLFHDLRRSARFSGGGVVAEMFRDPHEPARFSGGGG